MEDHFIGYLSSLMVFKRVGEGHFTKLRHPTKNTHSDDKDSIFVFIAGTQPGFGSHSIFLKKLPIYN